MKSFVLLLIIGLSSSAFGQHHEPVNIPPLPQGAIVHGLGDKPLSQYHLQTWTQKEGLPQNTVLALCQTRDGYLWFGTEEGLVRYDGVRFVVFDKSNTPTLQNNGISSILEDLDGALWIGTDGGGLNRLKNDTFTSYSTKNGLASGFITSLLQDHDGALWIGTYGGGLNRLKNNTFTSYSTKNGLASNVVNALLEDRDGALWIGTYGGGLNRLKNDTFTSYSTKNGLSGDNITSLLQDREGFLWIGTSNGLNRMKDGTFTTQNGLSNENIRTLMQDKNGAIWIGTLREGLKRVQDGKLSFFSTKNGFSDNTIVSLLEDREGNLWIGTLSTGLNRMKNTMFTTFTKKNDWSNKAVYSVLEDREGSLWIGTFDHGLYCLKNGILSAIITPKALLNVRTISSLLQDSKGALWIGTNRGLIRMKDGKYSITTSPRGSLNGSILSLLQDSQGALWIGTNNGLYRMKDDSFTTFTTKDGLSQNHITSLLQDRDDALWIGTGEGLNRMKDGKFTILNTQNGLSDNLVTALMQDSMGVLWIGTFGGLNRMKDGVITSISQKDGLFDDKVFCILEDNFGCFWMSCNKGIYRVRKSELNDFADSKLKRISCEAFGTADGMNNSEGVVTGNPPAWKGADGRLWFPTVEGVVMTDPNTPTNNPLAPPVIIEEVIANGTVLDLSAAATLPASMDKFEFHYTATSLLAPERMKFKYLLDGYDKEWVDASTRRTAYYTNLPRGRQYVFRVKACNNDGVWNEVGASAMLYLVPYFWETWLFYGLCGMLLLSSGLGAYWLRVRQLQNRSKALEIVVENRTSELRDANIEISRQMEIQTEQAREIELANSSLQEANAALSDSHTALNEAHERSELLLLNVLPEPIAERLKAGERTIADHFDSVSVLFADVVGFTKLSSRTTPEGLVSLLDRLFSNFDRLAEQFGLEKIKTIGDAYMVVGGLPIPTDDHLERVALFALALLPLVNEMADEFEIRGLAMRIGIHTGEVVAGVIGKKKFTYDIWGDTVNTASRMESHGEAGKIHVSEEVYDALKEKFVFEERGEMEVKGKGVMRTFFLTGSTIADHPESDQ